MFRWSEGTCCLSTGGPSNTPTPPKGSDCPPTTYYWDNSKACCVPRQPVQPGLPPPQCPKNWEWSSTTKRCSPHATTSSPPSSNPSQYPGNGNGHGKRAPKSRMSLCPSGLDACPIKGMTTGEYECLDISTELESCGGCSSLGKGQDCTTIKGAWNVGCEQGTCIGTSPTHSSILVSHNLFSLLLHWRLSSGIWGDFVRPSLNPHPLNLPKRWLLLFMLILSVICLLSHFLDIRKN